MKWESKTNMPTARSNLGAAVLAGVVYCAGGVGASSLSIATHEAYDTASDSWSTKAALPTERNSHKMVASGGYVYSFGGQHALSFPGTVLADVDRYDPSLDSWSAMTAMPNAQIPGCAILVGGVVYCIGGNDVTRGLTAMNQAYNVAGNSWSAKANMPGAVTRFAAFAVGQYIYCAAGLDLGTNNKVYRYDTIGDSWTTLTSAPFDSAGVGTTHTDGRGFVIMAGYGPYFYDVPGDLWTADVPTVTGGSDPALVTADTMYKFGGLVAGPTRLDSTEKYVPTGGWRQGADRW